MTVFQFGTEQPVNLAEIARVIQSVSAYVHGGHFPSRVTVDTKTLSGWMTSRSPEDAEAARKGIYWTHLFAAPIEPGYPVAVIWGDGKAEEILAAFRGETSILTDNTE